MSYKGILGVSNAGCSCPIKAFLELGLMQRRVPVFYKGILGVSNAGCLCPTKAFLELAMQGARVLQRHSWS